MVKSKRLVRKLGVPSLTKLRKNVVKEEKL